MKRRKSINITTTLSTSAVGYNNTLISTTGNYNTAVGYNALYNNHVDYIEYINFLKDIIEIKLNIEIPNLEDFMKNRETYIRDLKIDNILNI